jgi:hypothetical protein
MALHAGDVPADPMVPGAPGADGVGESVEDLLGSDGTS